MRVPYDINRVEKVYGLTSTSLVIVTAILASGFIPLRGEITTRHSIVESSQNRITFMSNRDGNSEIYDMDSDGKNIARLTYNNEFDSHPSVSPDGKIVFSRGQTGVGDIIMLGGYERGEKILLEGLNYTSAQSWSPDGKRIAFTSYGEDGIPRIYIINSDGSKLIRLTKGRGIWPAWSPSGTEIAYITLPENKSSGQGKVYVKDLKTNKVYQITDTYEYRTPAWRGKEKIVVSEDRVGAAGCLTEIHLPTGTKRHITSPADTNGSPSDPHNCFFDFGAVPLGKDELIFVRAMKDGSYQLARININGTGLVILTQQGDNWGPSTASPRDGTVSHSLGLEKYLFTEQNGLFIPSYPGFGHGYFNKSNSFVPLNVPSRVGEENHWNFVRQRLLEVP